MHILCLIRADGTTYICFLPLKNYKNNIVGKHWKGKFERQEGAFHEVLKNEQLIVVGLNIWFDKPIKGSLRPQFSIFLMKTT